MVARQISLALKKLVRLCLQTRISCLIKLSNFLYVHRSNPQQSVRSLQPKNVTVIIKPITYLIVDLHCTSCSIERINTVTIITPPSGRGLVIPIFFPWCFFSFFFWWSLTPDLRFSLGQTNTRRVFRYTGKGFYLE